jgi:hypothetical protein
MALGNLRRGGYAVTAILIIFEENQLEQAFGRLIAEGIDVRHVRDEAGLTSLCQQHLLR